MFSLLHYFIYILISVFYLVSGCEKEILEVTKTWIIKCTAKNQWFTGLLGIWPFCRQVRAQRSSRNRAAGTLETKLVNVDNKQHKKMMLEHILPAIVAQWPAADQKRRVYIQMDNALPHLISIDRTVEAEAKKQGLDLKIKRQPANSPDIMMLVMFK